MRLLLFALFLLPLSLLCQAQNENNIWYFGDHAGLDFNSGSPVPLNNSAMWTWEGSAIISDSTGNLLFYTNGIEVYDKNHATMPNGAGLLGGTSSASAAVIIPRPGTTDKYFVFTTPNSFDTHGLRYSEVDMTLNGGDGDVTATKNVLIQDSTAEKVIAVPHANKIDYWIIVHQAVVGRYLAFHVSATGVNPVPVVSYGTVTHNFYFGYAGNMRASLDGTKVASLQGSAFAVELFDFDNSTGVLSNLTVISTAKGPNGVEFSPDGKLMYVTEHWSVLTTDLYQYDVSSGDSSTILASQIFIDSINVAGGQLLLGPDCKIYHTRYFTSYLDVIENPNTPGVGCNFTQMSIDISPGSCILGLPNMTRLHSQDFRKDSIVVLSLGCKGDTACFAIESNSADSVLWDFGDPASGIENNSAIDTGKHVFGASGIYAVSLYSWLNGIPDTLTVAVEIGEVAPFSLGNDTIFCMGSTLILSAYQNGVNYLWQDSSTADSLAVTQTGVYWLELTSASCTASDTVNVIVNSPPIISLIPDTMICDGELLLLDASHPNATYLWQDGSSDSTFIVSQTGSYWVEGTLNGCTATDSVYVTVNPLPMIYLGVDTAICEGDTLMLDATTINASYMWNDGDTNAVYSVFQAGTYWVDLTVDGCTERDSIDIELEVCTSIHHISENQINIYPNPFDEHILIEWGAGQEGIVELVMTDALGKIVYQKQVSGTLKVLQLEFDTTIDSGIYFLNITTDSGTEVWKLLKTD